MIKFSTTFVILILTLFTLSSVSYAGGGKRNGTAGAQELLIPVGARGLAMSGAYVSGIEGIDAIFYNPAGFGRSSASTEAMFSYMNYIADIGFSYAALGVNFGELGALAFSLRTLDFGDIPVTTVENPYGTGATFSPTFVVAGITYSNALTDRIRVGVNVNIVSEGIMSTSASGFAFDAGIQYDGLAGVEGLQMGIVIKNLGPQMKFTGPDLIRQATEPNSNRGQQFYTIDAASFELPSQLELGLAYVHRFDQSYKGIIASSFQSNNFAHDEYRVAGEFSFNEQFFVRGGYAYVQENVDNTDESIWGPTFGAGFNIQTSLDITVDYAFRAVDYFDSNHMVSVKLGF
ncbi:MAG: hypothetical protein Kow0098_10980 [Ignavibacteriaceae bacterium]